MDFYLCNMMGQRSQKESGFTMSNPSIRKSVQTPQVIAPNAPKQVEKTIPKAPPAPPLKTTRAPQKKQTENLGLSNPEIERSIEQSSPQDIQKKQKTLAPMLLDIDKKIEQKRQELIKNSFDNDVQEMGNTTLTAHQVEVEHDFNVSELSNTYKDNLTHVDISDKVKDDFASFEQELGSTYLDKSKTKIFNKAKALATQSVMTGTVDKDFMYQLATLSESQLKDKIAKGIGANRSQKYGLNASYSDLSTKKKALVDSIYEGYKQGVNQSSNVIATDVSKNIMGQLEDRLQNAAPDSKLVFDLTLKSTESMKKELAYGMGMLSEGDPLSNLSEGQQKILDISVQRLNKVIQAHLPNRAGDIAPLQNRQDKSAPSTITLNGVRYNAPQYLGQGGLGMVLKYTNENDPNDTVVVKSLLDPNMREEMVKEALAHRHAMGDNGHKNIVGLRGMATGPNESLYMVMDLADGGDLRGMAKSMGGLIQGEPLLTDQAKNLLTQHFFSQMIEGMEYVQGRNMLHLDIKDENFLLDDKGTVKVADFGSSQRKTELDPKQEKVATTYKPMEWEMKDTLTQKTDTYQLGRMLYVMMGGQGSVGLVNPKRERSQEIQQNQRPDNDFVQNSAAHRLMTQMLDNDPNNRPTLESVKNHSFVKDYDPNNESTQELVSSMMDYHKEIQPVNRLKSRIKEMETKVGMQSTPEQEKEQIRQQLNPLREQLQGLESGDGLTQATEKLRLAVSNLRVF